MKILNPFDTGGLIFDYSVMVPRSASAAACLLLSDAPEDSQVREDEQELPAEFFAADPPSPKEDLYLRSCQDLSRRIRWGAVSVLGAPFAICQLDPYLRAVRQLGRKPPQHVATLVAFAVACVQVAAVVLLVLRDYGAWDPLP